MEATINFATLTQQKCTVLSLQFLESTWRCGLSSLHSPLFYHGLCPNCHGFGSEFCHHTVK